MKAEYEDESQLVVIHFNDVYDIEPNLNDQYGFVNFYDTYLSLKKQYPNSIVVFSGDAFAPSKLSKVKKGKQMVHCLKNIKIDIACFGNHQFDYPLQHTMALAKECQFPWLLSNVKNTETKRNLGDGLDYFIIERQELVIGFIGLAGPDFKGRLISAYKNIVQYEDCTEKAKNLCQILRKKGCNIIIAITHMRIPADQILAKNVPQIDLILGGHDHIVFSKLINKIPLLKSGSNFEHIGIYKILKHRKQNKNITYEGRRWSFITRCIPIPKKKQKYPQIEAYIAAVVKQYKQRGITKPQKFKKEKTLHPEDFWKFHFTNLNGKIVIQLSSLQRSQVVFTKYVCFQRKIYFSKSLPKPNYQLSEQNCIVSSIRDICQQIRSQKNQGCSVLYSSGLHFIPYVVETCNMIYLPNQITCTIDQIQSLHKILQTASNNKINCFAIIDIQEQFNEHKKQNRCKLTPTIKFTRVLEQYIKLSEQKKIHLFYDINLEVLSERYCVSEKQNMDGRILLKFVSEAGQSFYVDYEECMAFQKTTQISPIELNKNNQFSFYEKLIKLFNESIHDFNLQYQYLALYLSKYSNPRKYEKNLTQEIKPKYISVNIKTENLSKLEYLNTWVSYHLSKQYLRINMKRQSQKDEQEVIKKGVVFNQDELSYPTYELGYGYLPVLFSGQNTESRLLDFIKKEEVGEKKWFNLNQKIGQKQHPVYALAGCSQKNTKTTIIKNNKSNKTAEWVTKYAKSSYNNIQFVDQAVFAKVLNQFKLEENIQVTIQPQPQLMIMIRTEK